jgi:hypothetical protein
MLGRNWQKLSILKVCISENYFMRNINIHLAVSTYITYSLFILSFGFANAVAISTRTLFKRITKHHQRNTKPIFEESSWEWFNYMNFLSDIVKPRKTAASNITLQIREDYCSPSNNCYTSSFFDSNSEHTEQVSPHTPRNLESQEDEYDLEETSVPEKTFHE